MGRTSKNDDTKEVANAQIRTAIFGYTKIAMKD